MTKEEIKSRLIQTIEEIQSASGRPSAHITGSTRPMGGVAGFDSLNAVEVVTQLSADLRCEIDQDVGLFVQGRNRYTVDEIAETLSQMIDR